MARKKKQLSLLQDPRYPAFVERYAYDLNRFAIEVFGIEPTPQQESMFAAVELPGSRTSISSGHGCFAAGTAIMRADGLTVPVEDVRVGDRLMGADGNSMRTVLELRRGREEMYRLTYADGSSHTFNESHILCLVATNTKGRRKTGDKIRVTVREWLTWGEEKKRCHAVYRSGVEGFCREDARLPIPAYVLGAWLGDGHSSGNHITSADVEVIEAFAEYAGAINCDLVDRKTKNTGAASVYSLVTRGVRGRGHKHPMLEALRGLGVLGSKRIPDAYLYASKTQRLELLAGLLDTDGHLDAGSGGFDFIQKNECLAKQVAWLARSVGCHATVRQVHKTCGNNGKEGAYWRVTIGRNVEQIPVRIARKRPNLGVRQRANLHFSIKSVEALGEGDYFGFTLDGDHLFLGGDFTVLSNTGKTNGFSIIALWHLLCYEKSNTVITGPKLQTVQEGVWKEFADQMIRLQEGPHAWIAEHIIVKATKVSIRGYQANWWIVPKTAPRGRPESLAGQHRKYLMWLADEASGIPDANFGVITGSLTEEDNRMVMASQPTRPTGFFFNTHHKLSVGRGGVWVNLTFNSEESPLVSDNFLLEKVQEYGGSREDPQYMIKVRGLFPENLEGQLLGRSTLEACIGAKPVIAEGEDFGWLIKVDVGAGEYRDKSVVTVSKVAGQGAHYEPDPRRMHVVRVPICSNTIQPTALIAEVMNIAGSLSNATVLVDGGGMGLPVIKRMIELGIPNVVKVLWGNPCWKKSHKELFFNQRAHAQVSIARAAKSGLLSIAADAFADTRHETEMLDQGSRIPYHFDDKARFVIEPKGSQAWEGMPSPDIWDSMSFGFLEEATYIVSEGSGTTAVSGARATTLERLQAKLAAAGVAA